MYTVSTAFTGAVRGRTRSLQWFGKITLTDGTVIDFTNANIVENSGTLSKSCSSQSSIDLGGVYASELQISLRELTIDRYALPDAKIELFVRLNYLKEVRTWDDAKEAGFTWADMAACKWGDDPKKPYLDIPMGVFTISESVQSANSIKITAYDNMLEFDKTLPTIDTNGRLPFAWLAWICEGAGVPLGMTQAEVGKLANGRRTLVYATVNDQIATYRDLLRELVTALGAVAMIDRTGALVLKQYGTEPVDTVGADFRYSSTFSDYQSYYTGLYATYSVEGIQEYYRNVETEAEDTGLSMDIDINPFLQFSDKQNRVRAVKSIINGLKGRKYTPFNISMPLNPVYDLMDVLRFEGNQAGENDIAPITSITYKINDKMTVQCAGENPRLSSAQVKGSKPASALGAVVSPVSPLTGTDLWMKHGAFPTQDTSITDDTVVGTLEFESTVDNTRLQITWTGTFSADAEALATVSVYVDGKCIYTALESVSAGENRILTVAAGYDVTAKGEHRIEIHVKGESTSEPAV